MNDSSAIEIIVNGDTHTLPANASLLDLIEQLALGGRRFAVELNGEIVPRGELAGSRLRAGDRIEIVQAIGGG